MNTHHDYMAFALQLAERGRLSVSPNPMVGCVIVKNNIVVGHGFHQRAGEPHAEIYALQQAGDAARDATLYVTLEPCCHSHRTPPCTDALIRSGIKKIYIACLDPNAKVAGKGVAALKSAGIEVEIGLEEAKAKKLNEIFFHYITHQRPFVIAKWAMSLDGKTITHINDSRNISCPQSRYSSHELRQQVDAILVGAKTAIHDDPMLTVRLNTLHYKHPLRIVLASKGQLPMTLTLFDAALPGKTIVVTTDQADPPWCDALLEKNIEIIVTHKNVSGSVDLGQLLDELGKREITSLLVEGGMTVHESFFKENLVNKVHVYVAPVIIGSLEKKQSLTNFNFMQIDRDFYFTGNYKEQTCLVE